MNLNEKPSYEDRRAAIRATADQESTETADSRNLAVRSDVKYETKSDAAMHAAAHLHELLDQGNDSAAEGFLTSERFNLAVLKRLLELRALDKVELEKRLRDAKLQLAEIDRKIRERNKKAVEARKDQSKNPKIKAWLRKQEESGVNINQRHIAGQIGIKFQVSATYARNIRTEYLNEKTSKRN